MIWQSPSPGRSLPVKRLRDARRIPTARVMRGSKEQITLLLPPETLQWVEQRARSKGIARAALLSMVIHEAMEAMDAAEARGSRP